MQYITQLIVYLLAMIGIFFKSVETDEDGKAVYSDYGFPVLTNAGKTVVVLITLSFLISIYMIWNNSYNAEIRESNLRAELKKIEEQNSKGLERASSQIKDIFVSFEMEAPLQSDPDLNVYLKRLKKDLYEYQKRNKLRGFDEDPRLNDDYLPQFNTEEVAYRFLNYMKVGVNIYKKRADPTKFSPNEEKPDLSFEVTIYITPSERLPSDSQQLKGEHGGLFWEHILGDSVLIKAFDIPINPNKWNRPTDNISTIEDLLGAELVLYIDPLFYPSNIENAEFASMYNMLILKYFMLNVSGGHKFACAPRQGSTNKQRCTLSVYRE